MNIFDKAEIFWDTLPRNQKLIGATILTLFILFNLSGWSLAFISNWKHERFKTEVAAKESKVAKTSPTANDSKPKPTNSKPKILC